ncbi:hypothetical protein PAPYR_2088 [Paratrimastix pyriformis]|uniref:CHAT domain-containing protein n=1 Tax=Paratrimastix pyriformis TaxID=342808 RepID=A0ABQ8UXM6_9EUKA|nr:hypothetical protein PAPYR_2088 [Paratrimastix pyriformis]
MLSTDDPLRSPPVTTQSLSCLLSDDLWLYLADADASLELHCIISAVNHRLRFLMRHVRRLCYDHPTAHFLEGCPKLEVLRLPGAPPGSSLTFARVLQTACPRLRVLEAQLLTIACFGLLTEFIQHPVKITMVETADDADSQPGEAPGSLFTPSRVRSLALECHPADLPALLPCWPNLQRLELVENAEHESDALSCLTPQLCPNLGELRVKVPHLTTAPESLPPPLVSLAGVLTSGNPWPVFPAGLRECELEFKSQLDLAVLDLPLVEHLSVVLPRAMTLLTIQCPTLRSFKVIARPNEELCRIATLCPMPHLERIKASVLGLRLHTFERLGAADPSPTPPDGTAAPPNGIYGHLCAPLVDAAAGPLELKISLLALTSQNAVLLDLPTTGPWKVRDLELEVASPSSLRLPASVERLVLMELGESNEGFLSGPGLRTLELRLRNTRAGRLHGFLQMEAPLLEAITLDSWVRSLLFSVTPPVRTLVALNVPPGTAFSALAEACRLTLERLIVADTCRCPRAQDFPALRFFESEDSGFRRLGPSSQAAELAPAAEADLQLQADAGNAKTDGVFVVLLVHEDPALFTHFQSRLADSPVVLKIADPTPSALLDHLRRDRPDVVLLFCPCTRDALVLGTSQTPRLRLCYSSDLVRILTQAGVPVKVIMHAQPQGEEGCPDLFLGSLFEAQRPHGLILAGHCEFQDIARYLKSCASMGLARAVEALADVDIPMDGIAHQGQPRPVPSEDFVWTLSRKGDLGAHFGAVPLGQLAAALQRRCPDFCCQCPSGPPQFRLKWDCKGCHLHRMRDSAIDCALVLPDPASRLACLPRVRPNHGLLLGTVDPHYAVPVIECAGCRQQRLVMRSAAIAALPPFDERPPSPPPPPGQSTSPALPPPPSCPPLGFAGCPRAGPVLRVLLCSVNPNPAAGDREPQLMSAGKLEEIATNLKKHEQEYVRGSEDPVLRGCLFLGGVHPRQNFAVRLLEQPTAAALKYAVGEFRPDLVVHVAHGFRQAISIRGESGLAPPLVWLGPDALHDCFVGSVPPHAVLLLCCNTLALGEHLQRHLRAASASPPTTALERVVATADELTDVEASKFLSVLLGYAPQNPMPSDFDASVMVACRQAEQARSTVEAKIDPTTPLVLLRAAAPAPAMPPPASAVQESACGSLFSRGPTLSEAVHALRFLAQPLSQTPLRATCGCPEGPLFAIEYTPGCIVCTISAADCNHLPADDPAAGGTMLSAATSSSTAAHELAAAPRTSGWCTRCLPHAKAEAGHAPLAEVHLPYARRCIRCGQDAFLIPCHLEAAFRSHTAPEGPPAHASTDRTEPEEVVLPAPAPPVCDCVHGFGIHRSDNPHFQAAAHEATATIVPPAPASPPPPEARPTHVASSFARFLPGR